VSDEAGNPIDGAIVKLLTADVADTTSKDGCYLLTKIKTAANKTNCSKPQTNAIIYRNNMFFFNTYSSYRMEVNLYDIKGALFANVFDGLVKKGQTSVYFPLQKCSHMLLLLSVQTEAGRIICKYMPHFQSTNLFLEIPSASQDSRNAMLTDADQLQAIKSGFSLYSAEVQSYIDTVNITMKDTSGTAFFVDSDRGNDNNSGTSQEKPWKSVDKVSSNTFRPGDNIYFKRGSNYSEGFRINGDGTKNAPIIVSAYGSGNAPRFTNSDNNDLNGNCLQLNGDFQKVEYLYFHETNPAPNGDFLSIWKAGAIKVNLGANHAVIQNNEIENCPIGINSYSDSALITNNFIHDCNRVLNAPNWGPLGIRIGIGNHEISYNTIHNIHYMGGTWGGDGGAIEIDDGRNHHENIYIHHNKSNLNMGFIEMSYGFDICNDPGQNCNPENRIFKNIRIAYNEAHDYRTFIMVWGPMKNSYVENNTIVRTLEKQDIESNVFCQLDPPNLGNETTYRNNLVVVATAKVRDGVTGNHVYWQYGMPPIKHSNNIFYNTDGLEVIMGGSQSLKAEYIAGEIFKNPQFVDLTGGDYHLTATSPSINKGIDAGYHIDLQGKPVGNPPEIGAYEY
jgi:hypothetical protein